VETAAVLGERCGLPTAPDPLLDDRTPVPAPGEEALYPDWMRTWFGTVPGAERDEGGAQLSAAVAAYLADDRQLVLVTHAFVVAWFVQQILGAPVFAWTSIAAANAGLTTIDAARAGRCIWRASMTSGTSAGSAGDSAVSREPTNSRTRPEACALSRGAGLAVRG
jgi:broad specificity phosphatase PhoE